MKRAVAFSALWTASAAAAVGLGSVAVSLVDADASPVTQPIAATESVTAAPSPSGSGAGSDDAATPTPTSTPPVAARASGEHVTVGGTVLASCDGGVLQVAAALAAGWWVDDQDQHGEVEFAEPTRAVEVHVACGDGAPAFRDEGVRVGGRHGSDDPSGDDPAGRDDGDDDGGRGRGRGGDDSGSDD